MATKKPILCLMYDFDRTLCTSDMQDFGFIPDMNLTPSEFWGKCGEFTDKTGTERILSYMYVMIEEAKKNNVPLTREYLKSTGKKVQYYKGVETWFNRINKYGEHQGFKVEHYIISSGLKEIIEGCSIFNKFTNVYACEYVYDNNGVACWPKLMINYTQKTQFVFRISKGVKKISDDDKVNSRVSKEQRRVLYRDMIYIGDGITDIPCMQLVKDKGGHSIAVFKEDYLKNATQLSKDDRVNFVCRADYSEDSNLEKVVKTIIDYNRLEYRKEKLAARERKAIKGEE